MANTAMLTSDSGLSGQYQKFFDKKLLTAVLQQLVMDQFGQIRPLPPGMGATTVRFTRPPAPDRTLVQTLTEGTPISTDRTFAWSFVDATPTQVGEKATLSDILSETNLFDTLKGMTTLMGQDAAHYLDFRITKEIVENVSTNKVYSGNNTSWANLAASAPADCSLSIVDINTAFTKLTVARAPKAVANDRAPKAKGGDYVITIAPQVGFSVKLDPKFIDAGVRGNNDGLFNGELGSWYGLRLISMTQPYREATGGAENTYASAGGIYSSVALGSEEFGVVNLASQSMLAPKIIVVDRPDKTDVLNQTTCVGWKAFFTVKTLKEDWACVVRSQTTYS